MQHHCGIDATPRARLPAGDAGASFPGGPRLAVLPPPLLVLVGEPIQGTWLLALIAFILLVVTARTVLERRRRRLRAHQGPFLLFPATEMPAAHPAVPRPAPPLPAPPRPEPPPEVGGQTIRFDPALESTVQLLPGRLVVVYGAESGREYRFLRADGQGEPEVTVGRASGPSGRHLQLSSPTVSRVHARLSFRDRHWVIANISATNPVRVNGEELSSDSAVALTDGDRIELGEVELQYLD